MMNIAFFHSRQQALEAAISERDAQLGLLEVSGIKTAKAAERADHLKFDRKRLMELMRQQVTSVTVVIKTRHEFLFLK